MSLLRQSLVFLLLFVVSLHLSAQDSIGMHIADTVYLAPDTVVLEHVVYVEYSGTPERYWSLSASALAGNGLSNDRSGSAVWGGGALVLRNEGRLNYGLGICGSASSWSYENQQISYTAFEREETYSQVLDSFGKIIGKDTVWTVITRPAVRTVADSSQSVSYLPVHISYRMLGVPIQIGYEFKSGFLFARGYAVAEPGILQYAGARSFVVSTGAGIQSSYLLHPRWALWIAGQYMCRLTEISASGGRRHTVSLSIGASYLLSSAI